MELDSKCDTLSDPLEVAKRLSVNVTENLPTLHFGEGGR